MEKSETDNKYMKAIRNMDDLPTLPALSNKILEVVDSTKSAAGDLADIVSKDYSLTAKILKLVNSPFYGLRGKITSISHGIVILGFPSIKNLAFGISTLKSLGDMTGRGGLDIMKFWEHSLACAICGKAISKACGITIHGDPFVAGLLHDIGKLILNQNFPEEYKKVISLSRDKNLSFMDAENSIMGIAHNTVGKYLAEKWNLPEILLDSIFYHNSLPCMNQSIFKEHLPMLTVVYVANSLCKANGYSTCEWEDNLYDTTVLKTISLSPDKLIDVSKTLKEEIDIIKESFGI